MECPKYILELFSILDKNTFIIQSHAIPPLIDSKATSIQGHQLPPIRGIKDVFFKIPNNVFLVFGTPYKYELFDIPAVDENIISQIRHAGNRMFLSQNPDNYSRSESFGVFLSNLGLFCPGDMFFDFYITFEEDTHSFNIKKITKANVMKAYNNDRSMNLGRNLRNAVKAGSNNPRINFKLSEIVNELSSVANNNPTIIYLTSCNVSPTSEDGRALHDMRGAFIREYDSRAEMILDKSYSNIEMLREYVSTIRTRGRRRPVYSSNSEVYDEQTDHGMLEYSDMRGSYLRDKMKNAVYRVMTEFPYGWSNKGCVCISKCKKKEDFGRLSGMSQDRDKYFCEVDTDCQDEEIREDGGKRYHKIVRKYLAKCNDSK